MGKWLTLIGMDSYILVFRSHNINGKALKELQHIYSHLKGGGGENVSQLMAPLKMSLGHYLCFMNELRKVS